MIVVSDWINRVESRRGVELRADWTFLLLNNLILKRYARQRTKVYLIDSVKQYLILLFWGFTQIRLISSRRSLSFVFEIEIFIFVVNYLDT